MLRWPGTGPGQSINTDTSPDPAQVDQPSGAGIDAGQQQPVDLAADEVVYHLGLGVRVCVGVRHEHHVASGAGFRLDLESKLREERIADVGKHQPEHAGGSTPQRTSTEVRSIAEQVDSRPHSGGRGLGDALGTVVDHVAHHGGAHTGVAGNIGSGHRPPGCRESVVSHAPYPIWRPSPMTWPPVNRRRSSRTAACLPPTCRAGVEIYAKKAWKLLISCGSKVHAQRTESLIYSCNRWPGRRACPPGRQRQR